MPLEVGGMAVYSLHELSKMFNLTTTTLRNYIRRDRLRGQKVGCTWFVTEESLKDFLDGKRSADIESAEKK